MKRVLVIEDQDDVREAILEILEGEGYEGLGAEHGRRGVELARQFLPNIIISDIMMPELDGYGVLMELQQDPITAVIPFIFLTARTQPEDRRRGMVLGADDYLTKPFTRAELREAIRTRLAKQSALEQRVQGKIEELRANITVSLPHELRTPLTSIIGFSEILAEECESMKPEDIKNIARLLHGSGLRLQRLVENFVLYLELERTAMNPQDLKLLQQVEPASFTRPIIVPAAQQESQAAGRSADLILDVQDTPIAITAKFLKKLVEELVNNAFKFSSAGTPVEVTGHIREDNLSYLLAISDRGRGMTARQVTDIGAYMQFGRKSYEQQGAGLGLAIAKRIAELHGGTITLKSAPGVKTTVQVILPIVSTPLADRPD